MLARRKHIVCERTLLCFASVRKWLKERHKEHILMHMSRYIGVHVNTCIFTSTTKRSHVNVCARQWPCRVPV